MQTKREQSRKIHRESNRRSWFRVTRSNLLQSLDVGEIPNQTLFLGHHRPARSDPQDRVQHTCTENIRRKFGGRSRNDPRAATSRKLVSIALVEWSGMNHLRSLTSSKPPEITSWSRSRITPHPHKITWQSPNMTQPDQPNGAYTVVTSRSADRHSSISILPRIRDRSSMNSQAERRGVIGGEGERRSRLLSSLSPG
jgi:hypothetical protein